MYKQKIQLWFETERGGGLVLPDGWFGRPYDNIHTLASVDESEDALVVVLSDGRETLRIAGLQSLEADGPDLVFSGYTECRFEWKGIGTRGGTKIYREGQIKLVSHRQQDDRQ